jgi:ssDNA thymidine ADP-ribosyltransferase, DarT
MMYKRAAQHRLLCVLRISTEVFDLPGVIIADGNAASGYTGFWSSKTGLDKVDFDLVFAEWWTDDSQIQQWHKARVKCAEVLVPNRVDPHFIQGAYVSCQESQRLLEGTGFGLPVIVDPKLFFQI